MGVGDGGGLEERERKSLEGRSHSFRPSQFGEADQIDDFTSIWSSFPSSEFLAVIKSVMHVPLMYDLALLSACHGSCELDQYTDVKLRVCHLRLFNCN